MSATPMSFRLSPHTTAQLKALCLAMGLERQVIVTMAIDRMAQSVLRDWTPQVEPERESER